MRSYFKAFVYAWNGIIQGALTERNMKSHLITAAFVVVAGVLTGLSSTEWLIILLLFGGMLSLEMMNSAIERVVDLVTSEQHPLAGQAKDLAAGAVLFFAIISAIIGCFIFFPKWF